MKHTNKHGVTSLGLKVQPLMCPYNLSMWPCRGESSQPTKEQVGPVVPKNGVPFFGISRPSDLLRSSLNHPETPKDFPAEWQKAHDHHFHH